MQSVIKPLYQVFRRYRGYILVLCVLGVVGALLEGIGINIAIPLLSFFTGGGTPTDTVSSVVAAVFKFFHIPFTFRYLLGFILGLFFLRALAVGFFNYIRGYITADFLSVESRDLFGKLLRASWPFLLAQKIGNVQSALVRDVQRTSNLLDMLTQFIQSGTGFVMYCVVALMISPMTTFIALGGAVVLLVLIKPLLGRTVQTGEDMSTTEKQIAQFLSEHIIGMKVVKAAGVAESALNRARVLVSHLRAAHIRLSMTRSLSSSLFQPFSLVFVVLLFFLTYKTPGFSIISFGATLYLVQKIFTYAQSAQSSLHGVGELVPYVRNMLRFKRELEIAREHKDNGHDPFIFNTSLTFDEVSLSYGDKKALKNISLTIPAGTTVAFIGPSGAGKTSLADLLLRLFEPSVGSITLDGKPARDISIDEWRTKVAYVPQEVFLLNASIADNVRFYRDISDEDVVRALTQAHVYEVVKDLPQGIHTHVGDRGVFLSGGQRQRVALARSLAGSPAMLVLDEATSALDQESERAIQEALKGLSGTITIVIIAHRLSTIEHADTIVVLEDGEVTEQGSPAQLRKNPTSYFAKHTA